MMKPQTIIAGAAMCIALGACGNSGHAPEAFDYETASQSERLEWMAPRAEAIASGLDEELNAGSDDPIFTVDIPKMDPDMRHVGVDATAKKPLPAVQAEAKNVPALLRTLCKSYANTPYSGDGVETTVRILGPDGDVVMIVNQSKDICDRVLADS